MLGNKVTGMIIRCLCRHGPQAYKQHPAQIWRRTYAWLAYNSANMETIAVTTANTPTVTIQEVKADLIQQMGLEHGYSPLVRSRSHLLEFLPKTQDELPLRTMQDSFSQALIPLSTDMALQEKYVTFLGSVRLGRLLEDMDLFAVWVTMRHLSNPKVQPGHTTPYVIVTVQVDQIDFTDYVAKANADIRLSGHVSWVGTSSIETVVWLEQNVNNSWHRLTRALFMMVARNSTNTASAPVNRLEATTEKEKVILAGGADRRKRRMHLERRSLFKEGPTAEEQEVLHSQFLKTMKMDDQALTNPVLPPNSVWIDSTAVRNIIFSHPEDRNMHNKVFGGFLMRHAMELSWTCCFLFSRFRPKLYHISDIGFYKPVSVGSLLRMHSHVVYTEQNYMQAVVYAEVYDPSSGQLCTTNAFHFTYHVPEPVKTVIPQSYSAAMMCVDGRRHFQRVLGLAQK